MARTRYRFSKDQRPHFMTNTIVAWLPVFAYPDYVNIVLDSWRFLQRGGRRSNTVTTIRFAEATLINRNTGGTAVHEITLASLA